MASADYKGIVDFAQAIDDTYVRKDAPSVPVGGAKGEVLRKKSNADGDAEWANPLYHFSTLAQMQAALALGQIPDGANVSVEEEQPGGNTGDTSLDTTSENWVQNKVVATAISNLNSDLTNKIDVGSIKSCGKDSLASGNNFISYPTGFNRNNSIIIAVRIGGVVIEKISDYLSIINMDVSSIVCTTTSSGIGQKIELFLYKYA